MTEFLRGMPAALPFVGTWSLESFSEQTEHLELNQPLGPNPSGLLMYTEEGFVSAQLMRINRRELSGNPWDRTHASDLSELAEGYIAYCGRFAVNEESRQVIHTPLVALIPNRISRAQLRTYVLGAHQLILETTHIGADGSPIKDRLVWQRLSV